jgi:hypothetical protein
VVLQIKLGHAHTAPAIKIKCKDTGQEGGKTSNCSERIPSTGEIFQASADTQHILNVFLLSILIQRQFTEFKILWLYISIWKPASKILQTIVLQAVKCNNRKTASCQPLLWTYYETSLGQCAMREKMSQNHGILYEK